MNRPKGGLNLSAAEIRATFECSDWATRFPPVLTTPQAGDLLQVPLGTIYDWSSRGLLRGCSRRVGPLSEAKLAECLTRVDLPEPPPSHHAGPPPRNKKLRPELKVSDPNGLLG